MPSARSTRNWRRKISMALPPVCKKPPNPLGACPGLEYYLDNFLVTSQIEIFQGGGLHSIFAETYLQRVGFGAWTGIGPAFYKIDPPPPIQWTVTILLDYNLLPCFNTWTYVLEDSPPTTVGIGSWDREQKLPSLTPDFFVQGILSIGTDGTIAAQA
jgi:hypothetical protein